jgi:hypothetical protein
MESFKEHVRILGDRRSVIKGSETEKPRERCDKQPQLQSENHE